MNILGIETSCDDTGVAVVEARANGRCKILANVVKGQDHAATGGVVPEMAARHHAVALLPTLDAALQKAGKKIIDIDCVAVTVGPGLAPCLLVGLEAAKTLAMVRHLPIIGVNHLIAHMASTSVTQPHIAYPAVVLLVSGGHTMLIGIKKRDQYHVIGRTRDDAVGEAFDKVARLLGLAYPGGPKIALLAASGNAAAYNFPRPMINSADFDFSFAGIKTAVLYKVRDLQKESKEESKRRKQKFFLSKKIKADIAASFQASVIDVLIAKTLDAATLHQARTVILCGGVSANRELQVRLRQVMAAALPRTKIIIPAAGLFTDNGAMIALAAAPRALQHNYDDWTKLDVNPKLKIT